jgi:hypothetical protein
VTKTVTRPEAKKETAAIRYMIHERLKARLATESRPLEPHLDEDAICAFVEGRLEEAESSPVISHLIACASCRQTTAQLVRFGSQFDPESDSTAPEESGHVPPFLERLASRLAPSFEEDAVFAYHDPAAKPDQDTEVITGSKPETVDDGE